MLVYPPQLIILLIILECFPSVKYVIPLLLIGALASTSDLFLRVDNEQTWKNPAYAWRIATIGRNTYPMAASSGFYQSPGPPPLGDARSIVPAHHPSHQNDQQSWCIFSSLFCLLLPWWPPGWYGASSCPMVAPRGFQCSPGHAALGNMSSIAPTHPHGHQNGLQQRCIC